MQCYSNEYSSILSLSALLSSEATVDDDFLFPSLQRELNEYYNTLLLFEMKLSLSLSSDSSSNPLGSTGSTGSTDTFCFHEYRVSSIMQGKVNKTSTNQFECKTFDQRGYFLLSSFSSFSSLTCTIRSPDNVVGSLVYFSPTSKSIQDHEIVYSFRLSNSLLSSHSLQISISPEKDGLE